MRDEVKYPVLIGRLLDLFSRGGDPSSEDHRTALRALVELAGARSATLRVDTGSIRVEGIVVPDDTPFLELVKNQLNAHGIASVHIASGASAVDLVHAIRSLAGPPAAENAGDALEAKLREAAVTTVTVVTTALEAAATQRRKTRVTDALRKSDMPAAEMEGVEMGLLPSDAGAAYDEMMRHERASRATIAGEMGQLQHFTGAALRTHLEGVQAAVTKALSAKEYSQALEAVVRLVRQEAGATEADSKRAYGVAVRRILSNENIRRIAPFLIDEMYATDVIEIMQRAGTSGTKILMDLLIEAPTQAERKAYLRAVRQIEEGTEVVTSLLNHHEWFVVRNAADLVGEMRIAEAVDGLGRSVDHHDPRVRKSIGIALARIATPAAALHLRKIFRDPDPEVRMAVVKEVGGKGLGGLAMPLVSAADAEEDEDILCEYYRALGRIGTAGAVQALSKAAQSGSRGLLGRKATPPQLAAVEGLAAASDPTGRGALEELAKHASADVKAAARKELARLKLASGE